MEKAIEKFINFLNKPSNNADDDRKELFADEPKKVSLQVVLHKIPNLINDKQILCKLPNPIVDEENPPEVCLFVKDIDKKDRDYERTVRKYTQIIKNNQLENFIKKIIPLKQLNLEFRPFEAKRVLSTSFDIFLTDKSLHEILHGGSKLGKEFGKRRKMPIEIDVENSKDLRETVLNVLHSTIIRLTGKGAIIDINAFLSTHSVEQAVENINTIKTTLAKCLPGGEANIKSIYLKSTNTPALPIFVDETGNSNLVHVPNNMSKVKKNRANKLTKIKRLKQSVTKTVEATAKTNNKNKNKLKLKKNK